MRISIDTPFVLINCAFDFKAVEKGGYQYKYAVFERNIATLYRKLSARFINISSMSAYPHCRSSYGREKLFIENLFSRYTGINVRPGLIVSWRRPGAAFLNLINIVKRSKLIPVLSARNSGFYFCDLEATLLGIYFIAGLKFNKPHTVSFCYRERLSLRDTLRMIEDRYEISRAKITVHWRFAYFLLLIKEALAGKSKVRADSVLDFSCPTKIVFGRGIFARLVEYFRNELEAISRADAAIGGFYFLEPARGRTSQMGSCRMKDLAGPEVVALLGKLPDAQSVR